MYKYTKVTVNSLTKLLYTYRYALLRLDYANIIIMAYRDISLETDTRTPIYNFRSEADELTNWLISDDIPDNLHDRYLNGIKLIITNGDISSFINEILSDIRRISSDIYCQMCYIYDNYLKDTRDIMKITDIDISTLFVCGRKLDSLRKEFQSYAVPLIKMMNLYTNKPDVLDTYLELLPQLNLIYMSAVSYATNPDINDLHINGYDLYISSAIYKQNSKADINTLIVEEYNYRDDFMDYCRWCDY